MLNQRLWLFDGQLSPQMKNIIHEVETVLSHKRRPWNRKQVPVSHRFAPREGIAPFVLAHKLARRLRPRRELVVDGEAHRPFLLHPQEEPEAVERDLLIHVAVR